MMPSTVDPPTGCMGCGLQAAVDDADPAPHETTFSVQTETDDGDVVFECKTCGTLTHVPHDPEPTVACRTCGDDIPESLQGNHACEAHPLGLMADRTFENPLEDHR